VNQDKKRTTEPMPAAIQPDELADVSGGHVCHPYAGARADLLDLRAARLAGRADRIRGRNGL
jgi:hypothetical protein